MQLSTATIIATLGLIAACSGDSSQVGDTVRRLDKGGADAAVCFTPDDVSQLQMDRQTPGCTCEPSRVHASGFCVDGLALECWDGHWTKVIDGPCVPPGIISVQTCEERGGEQLPALEDHPLLNPVQDSACPDGRILLGAITVEDGVGQARCCSKP